MKKIEYYTVRKVWCYDRASTTSYINFLNYDNALKFQKEANEREKIVENREFPFTEFREPKKVELEFEDGDETYDVTKSVLSIVK